jgi:hypothetical protein
MKGNRSKILFALMQKNVISLVFASEAKRKYNEAKKIKKKQKLQSKKG